MAFYYALKLQVYIKIYNPKLSYHLINSMQL